MHGTASSILYRPGLGNSESTNPITQHAEQPFNSPKEIGGNEFVCFQAVTGQTSKGRFGIVISNSALLQVLYLFCLVENVEKNCLIGSLKRIPRFSVAF